MPPDDLPLLPGVAYGAITTVVPCLHISVIFLQSVLCMTWDVGNHLYDGLTHVATVVWRMDSGLCVTRKKEEGWLVTLLCDLLV